MADKKAFVFDTNFIIENKKHLDEVINNLKTEFNIYVTQFSIDERIAQNCRAVKEKFEEVEKCAEKHHDIAQITFRKTLEEAYSGYQTNTPQAYKKIFGHNIIPYDKDGSTFELILERANMKEPPFSKNKDASDKGFKDCLLWLSLLNYFKENGEEQVIFLTDDKSAFRNHIEYLTKEFKVVTGKDIEFKPNSYYNEFMDENGKEQKNPPQEELPDVSLLRDRINSVIHNLCGYETEDDWGDEYWEKHFKMNLLADSIYAKNVLEKLPNIIKENIFEQTVSPYDIFDFDNRLQNGASSIPIEAIETAHRLHEEVKEKYPDYLEQFYLTVSNIFNDNYTKPQLVTLDDDLPF